MTTKIDAPQNAFGHSPRIESRDQLIATFAKARSRRTRGGIGTEHEKFVYRVDDHRAPSYDEPGGIRDLLMALTEYGWKPVEETGQKDLTSSR